MSQLVQAQTPTIDLTTHEPTAVLPAGVTLEWHNALPIGPGNLLSPVQTQSATPGVYYAVFNYGGTPVCYSQPSYLRVITNVCPATTVDLQTAVDAAATPVGSVVTYHTALTGAGTVDGTSQLTPAQVAAAPTSLSGTTYYVAYFDPVANCYSQPSPIVAVTTNCCLVTGITPVLSASAITNICPVTTINLSAITANNAPASTSLTWHSGTPATAANQLLSITAVSAGTYFAAFFDPINNCYSGTAVTPVTATTVLCAQPPVARGDIANTNVNTPVSGNVLTNDTDPQGLPLTASLLTQPAAGTVVLSPTGSFTYTPPAGFTGTVSFCYTASNTAGLSASACVSVNVNPQPSLLANDAPIANNDNTLTRSGVAVTVAVLANDSDPDSATSLAGQLANPTLLAQPTVGTAVVNANGTVTYTPPVGFTGVVSFPYQVCDGASPALCATALVTVVVQPTPPAGTTLAPVAVDDALVTSVNTPGVGNVSSNDRDPQGLPLTYVSGQPVSGTVVMSPTGSYTYTPAAGFVGPDSFTYSVCNSAGLCDKATVSVLVQQPANQPPIVTPDVNTFIPGTPTAGNVLTNDRDPEGTPLTASVVGTPPAGLTLSPNGSYTYTSPLSQTAPVTVVINVCDSATPPACTTSTLTLVPVVPPTPANEAPIALNDATRTTVGVSTTLNVLANDKDPEGLPLSNPTILSQPTVGTAVVNANGTVTYTPPAGFTGVVTFPYQVCDTGTPVACATAVVTVAVDPTPPAGVTNIAPVAIDDQLLTTKNVSATGTVAANDSDPNVGQTLTFSKLTDPANGTVVFAANGSYTYMPPVGFVGTTNFTYQVCDNGVPVLCTPATVYITVSDPGNQPPIVTPDVNTFIPGTPTAGNVLTNDRDPEGTPLTASVVGTPPAGLTLSPNGSYTYTSPLSQTAPVTVVINVCDSATPPACTTSTLTLVPVVPPTPANESPVALNDATRTTVGVSTTLSVLANDKDPEGLPLSNPTILSQPTVGTAVVNANGTVTYTPPAGFTGVVTFPYQVCDTGTPVACATAVVTVAVDPTPPAGVTNIAPVAIDDQLLTTKNVSATGTVAANDSDPNVGQTLTFSKLTDPANGTVVFAANGTYTYTPPVGFVGTTNFTYQVCDNGVPVLCTPATVYITVSDPLVQAPVARGDIANTNVNTPVSGNVLTNDTDPQGLPLTASLLTQPAAGTVVLSPTGSFTYTPPAGFTGTVSFCYTASNTAGLSASACVSVNVNPQPSLLANDAPIANNDNTLTRSGVAVTVAVLANDSDPDSATSLAGQLANPTLLAQPTVGTAVVNANGTVTYTPPVGFTGVVSFPYQVCDGASPALCATALVTVVVQPTPPAGTTLAPVAVDDALLTSVNTPGVGNVSGNDRDPQGLPLTYVSGQPVSGTVVLSPTGSYTYTPAAGFVGPDSFTYSVCNSAGLCDKATVSVLVQQPVNNALVLRLKVMLQGALVGGSGGLMRDDLRSRGFLPATEPYTAIGGARFTHVNGGGGETMPASVTAQNVGTGNAVVDWVFVELRNPANMSVVVATRAALVQRDGDVVLASDGVSPLSFTGLSGTSFYVSVKHRNHLGVMTASAIPLSTTGTLVDFTSLTGPQLYNTVIGAFNYEGWEQINVNGVQALWAGNANHDVKVKYQGSANDLITIFSEVIQAQTSIGITNPIYNYDNALGYYFGDVNMDGKVKYQGTSNDTSLIFTNVITNYRTDTMMNVDRLYNFDFMLEQIP